MPDVDADLYSSDCRVTVAGLAVGNAPQSRSYVQAGGLSKADIWGSDHSFKRPTRIGRLGVCMHGRRNLVLIEGSRSPSFRQIENCISRICRTGFFGHRRGARPEAFPLHTCAVSGLSIGSVRDGSYRVTRKRSRVAGAAPDLDACSPARSSESGQSAAGPKAVDRL
jgi:hypothetical protein